MKLEKKTKLMGAFEYKFMSFMTAAAHCPHMAMSCKFIAETYGQGNRYTRGTIVKALDRLHKKGLILRKLKDGVFVYYAGVSREELEEKTIQAFISGYFNPPSVFFAAVNRIKS